MKRAITRPRRRGQLGDRLCSAALLLSGIAGNLVLWGLLVRHFG